MATYTPNYNLAKPEMTDPTEDFLTDFGANMDIIDQNLGGGGGSSTLAGLSDVNLTSPITGDALIYDGAEWVNSPLSAVAFSGDYSDLSNAPAIPTKTSDLNNDSDFVSDASYVHTDNNFTNADVTKLSGIQAGAEVNVQSDWNEADNTADDYIKNKPTIPTNTSDLNNDSGFLDSSDITVTQVQTTGTKIATIDVDGNSTDIYAPNGGGGSKHTILNESGTALADEPNLQFADGLKASDDSGNSKTKVGVDTTFTEAVTRTNIASGDTFSTILGKIKKWFTDIPSLFVSKTGDTMTGALTINRASDIQAVFSRKHTGTSSAVTSIDVGNNVADGTAGSTYGRIRLFGKGAYRTNIYASLSSANRDIEFPNKSGTVALTSDIPDVSGKVNKSGDTMTGNLKIDGGNGVQLMNGGMSTMLYQQAGAGAVANLIGMPNESGTLALQSDITDGTCAYLNAPRQTAENLNNFPTQNKSRFDECSSGCSNLPSANWYYVFTIQGSDTGYAGQLAMQMTGGNAVYYRAKDGGTWSSWRSL